MSGSNYPSDWDSRRQSVYERDEYTCQNCGRTVNNSGELEAHHIVPVKNGGSHSQSNLVAMCVDCHNAIHNDKQAPTAHGNTSVSTSVTNYEDIDEFHKYTKWLADQRGIYVSSNISDISLGLLIQAYQKWGIDVRKRTRELNNQFVKFDPYDNPDSEHVSDEFKDMVDEYVLVICESFEQILAIDRLLQKYVQEATTVKCSGCGKSQPEEDSFCGECGSEIPVLSMCPNCHTYREEINQEFCKSCGTDLNEYPDTQISQIDMTRDELASKLDELSDLLSEISDIQDNQLMPLWKDELR